jgi:signal transduction histidine kinase
MGEMAAGLAHEINQPLAAIVNYAQGCSRRLRADAADVDAILPVIDDIAAEGLRAGEIIRRLRNLVRKEPPRQDWVHLAGIAAEALRLVESDAHQQVVTLRLDAEPVLPRVLGDPIQIEQVVLNLLRNAIDAMADVRGRRELHVRIARAGSESVELTVRDTGHGMPSAVAERIFDPFYSTKPNGLGMGLSISRSIVEAHQGRLTVVANTDGGATFRITLPVVADPTSVAAAAG